MREGSQEVHSRGLSCSKECFEWCPSEKKIIHLLNRIVGAIVRLWPFFKLKLMVNGFVRSMTSLYYKC